MRDTESSEPLRVVVADDHPFYREGLARLLGENGIESVASVPNGEAALTAVRELAPDVVVMDLNMPGMSGVEATRRLSEESPATRVLVLSVSAQESDVTDAILAGARGYVLKDAPIEEVVAGIRLAAAGGSLISPRIASQLLRRIREHAGAPAISPNGAQLSERELRGAQPAGRGQGQPTDRRLARDQREHGAQPHLEHPAQASGRQPRPGRGAGGSPGIGLGMLT